MFDRLEAVEKRFEELTALLSSPEIATDRDGFRKCSKEHAELEPIVTCFREYRRVSEELQSSKELLDTTDDSEMRELAHEEVTRLKVLHERLHQELILALLPKDPNDDKNVIVEIRAGTGGDEAALFAADLFSMFTKYLSDGTGVLR